MQGTQIAFEFHLSFQKYVCKSLVVFVKCPDMLSKLFNSY